VAGPKNASLRVHRRPAERDERADLVGPHASGLTLTRTYIVS
jgi:hypothetical protein